MATDSAVASMGLAAGSAGSAGSNLPPHGQERPDSKGRPDPNPPLHSFATLAAFATSMAPLAPLWAAGTRSEAFDVAFCVLWDVWWDVEGQERSSVGKYRLWACRFVVVSVCVYVKVK